MRHHVVLGAGQIGTKIAAELAARGERVTVVRRSEAKLSVKGASMLRGDLSDAAFAAEVGKGATHVYQCTNPKYHRWPQELLANTEGAIRVASVSGARLVVLDCLYAYGDTGSEPRREDTPLRPCSRKGELRKQMAERYDGARGTGLAVTLVRASDFVGPGMELSMLGERGMARLMAGSSVEAFGDVDAPHAFTYGEDVARTMLRVGELETATPVVHVPTLPAIAPRAWVTAAGAALGRTPKITRVPAWVLRAFGLIEPQVGEMVEMLYQFERPFLFDDARSRALLGFGPTPFEEQVRATAAWAEQRWGVKKAA
jgi:nucleoside-diphosphate-sugar epimerase